MMWGALRKAQRISGISVWLTRAPFSPDVKHQVLWFALHKRGEQFIHQTALGSVRNHQVVAFARTESLPWLHQIKLDFMFYFPELVLLAYVDDVNLRAFGEILEKPIWLTLHLLIGCLYGGNIG